MSECKDTIETRLREFLCTTYGKVSPGFYGSGLGVLQPCNGLSGGKDFRMHGGDMIVTGETMAEASDEDTSKIDIELIANDLERTAKLAGRLNQTEIATEIGALVAKYRDQAKAIEG